MSEQTPMMRQYARLKEQYHDAVLFFRLGDFYEMFRSDAEDASRLLGLTLTQRQGIPMCGIPYHAARGYIARLLEAGRKVAICEQTKLPDRGLAEREVVEVVTPGTVTEEDYLERSRNNYIAALFRSKGDLVFCYADISTGELVTTRVPAGEPASLRAELARIAPRELLVQQTLLGEDSAVAPVLSSLDTATVDRMPDWYFDTEYGYERLTRHFGTANLKGFGFNGDEPEIAAAGVLVQYLYENTGGEPAHLRTLERRNNARYVTLDESTQLNLEVVVPGSRGGYSLRETVDETATAMGARLLARRLLAPLTDPVEIHSRLDAVHALYHNQQILSSVRRCLEGIGDLERLSARVAMGRAHAKDLQAIGRTLLQGEELAALLEGIPRNERGRPPELEMPAAETRERLHALQDTLDHALVDNPSTVLHEGNMIRPEFDEQLGRLFALRENGRSMLDSLLEEERAASGIQSLKLKFNRVLGHFFEVSKARAGDLPEHFIRRQSMSNAERFTTARLSELETELVDAEQKSVEREQELFLELRESVASHQEELSALGSRIAAIDVHASNAYLATVGGYTRPNVDDSEELHIEGGRHPVVEAHLPAGEFVPNSLSLADNRLVLLTGPNMAGKSTFLRQTALIVLLAQSGAFVPAERADIGAVDRIFCRVGAGDNLARGESTFLVEMNETANILRYAGARSLVIMDEVGRGTGTSDGISIARAVTEYLLHELGSRTLFATHYHELTGLDLPGMTIMRMAVSEEQGEVVFLKRVEPGPSHRSYGIHVARLAGLPAPVVQRAEQLLAAGGAGYPAESMTVSALNTQEQVDEEGVSGRALPGSDTGHTRAAQEQRPQQDLFAATEWLPAEIRALDIEHMTPVQALSLLDQWKRLLER